MGVISTIAKKMLGSGVKKMATKTKDPKMIKTARTMQYKVRSLGQAKRDVERLEKILKDLGDNPVARKQRMKELNTAKKRIAKLDIKKVSKKNPNIEGKDYLSVDKGTKTMYDFMRKGLKK